MIIRSRKQPMIIPCTFIALSFAFSSAFGDQSVLLRGKHLNRRLNSRQVQFVNDCATELLVDTVLGDKMISQIEFTDTYLHLCTSFGVSDCSQDATFETLDKDIQFAFAADICHGKSSSCLKSLISLSKVTTEVGYIVSSQPAYVENLVNNICVELEYAVFGDSSDGVDLVGVDSGPTIVASENGTNATNVVGAATAGSACLLLLYLLAGQRKNRQQNVRAIKDLESNTSYRTESSPDHDSSIDEMMAHLTTPSLHQRTSIANFTPNMVSDSEEVFEAIRKADWYKVYNLASKISEREDLSTISSFSMRDLQRSSSDLDLSHLSMEDQHRTRTLDRLAKNRDWTGVAVTAALYADESMMSIDSSFSSNVSSASGYHEKSTQNMPPPSLDKLKERIDTAVDSGDWERVLALSSVVEDTSAFEGELPTLLPQKNFVPGETLLAAKETLNEALFKGDWAVVGVYANKVRELQHQAVDCETSVSIAASEPLYIDSAEFSDSAEADTIKKQTIAKLVNEGKWKGVSIMAGLYDMEMKGSLSTPDSNLQMPA